MMVDVHAHELAETPRPPQLAEVCYEPRRVACETNNGSIHVHNERVRAVDFRSRGRADI